MNAESTSERVDVEPRDGNRADHLSRRAVLGAAVGGVAVVAAVATAATSATPLEPRRSTAGSDELQDLLRKYGSEFGALRSMS